MPSSGMLSRVAHVTVDISDERITLLVRVERIGDLETTLATAARYYQR
jgi:hypothetical protein